MKPTLLILAAGRGSRFGGAKQVTPMGPNDEAIMEYSIYDALRNGFENVVLVINKEVEKDTFSLVKKMTGAKNKISYAYQDLFTEGIPTEVQVARLKPWGTAHAVLSAYDQINGAFAMINADDYYGTDAFKTMADFLQQRTDSVDYSMIGYDLVNTLSPNGTVSRGVSISDENGLLSSITEMHGIIQKKEVIHVQGENGKEKKITEGLASMNFWGFQNNLFDELNNQFKDFLDSDRDLTKEEYQIPSVINEMIKKSMIQVSVLHSTARWFGITYKKDQMFASQSIQQYVKGGKYPSPLWV